MKGEALLVMGLPCAQRQEKLQFCQSDSDAAPVCVHEYWLSVLNICNRLLTECLWACEGEQQLGVNKTFLFP